MDGEALRRIHPDRILNTGDILLSAIGQGFELVGFHCDGVVVIDPLGTQGRMSWDVAYQFYEPETKGTP